MIINKILILVIKELDKSQMIFDRQIEHIHFRILKVNIK